MTEQPCSRVKRILGTGCELMHYVGKKRVLLSLRCITPCVLGIERKGHIEAVQPHLMRIYLLVPELT